MNELLKFFIIDGICAGIILSIAIFINDFGIVIITLFILILAALLGSICQQKV